MKKKLLIGGIVGVLLLGAAGGAYWYMERDSFVCPEDQTSEEAMASLKQFIDEYVDAHPDATLEEFGEYRVKQLTDHECTKTLEFMAENDGKEPPRVQQDAMQALARVEAERTDVPRLGDAPTPDVVRDNALVAHIRTALNSYLAGSDVGIESYAIDGSVAPEGVVCGLSKFDRSKLTGKFLITSAKDYVQGGGMNAEIAFLENPESLYWVWIYKYGSENGDGEIVMRSFCKSGPPEVMVAEFVSYVAERAKAADAVIF